MSKREICRIEVVFEVEAGYPRESAGTASDYVEALLNSKREPAGLATCLRYADARVVKVTVP